jgi:type II secretory pathway pseudopilin PulG
MRRQQGWTLVATMVVLVIMCLLAVALFKGGSMFGAKSTTPARKDGHGTTVLGAAEWAAKDTVCRSNISQVRQALQIAESNDADDKYPATLQETHLPKEFYSCPVGHEPYAYDPATGEVHCVHPGHEKY